ncbi:DoxX family protein [Nocardioides houyundeii]|uniref:DoxX family protein n=1 Tax=Nocardioides houyundeii TaxID=2045452 RepID=UPI000DF48F3F|nr:DoxX family protein [Nocardioides houyundeii]
MAISRLIARPLLSTLFVYGGYHAVKSPDALVAKAKRVTDRLVPLAKAQGIPIPEDPATLVRINGAVQVAAAAMLATGRAPRTSATVLAASLVPTTVAGHPFWEDNDRAARATNKMQVAKNLSLLGGLLLAAVDTEGKPGVAWRARRVARDARRQAGHLAHDAKLEARLVAKSIR